MFSFTNQETPVIETAIFRFYTSFKHWLYVKMSNISANKSKYLDFPLVVDCGISVSTKKRHGNIISDSWAVLRCELVVCGRKIWYIVGSLLQSLWLQMMTYAQDSSAGIHNVLAWHLAFFGPGSGNVLSVSTQTSCTPAFHDWRWSLLAWHDGMPSMMTWW